MIVRWTLVSVLPALLLFANCSGVQSSTPSSIPLAAHSDLRRSWFAPDIRSAPRLAFITDRGNFDVVIYSLPGLKLEGRITGFYQPTGECSNARGDVWVTDASGYVIRRYSHAGVLLTTLTDSYGFPTYCAVDEADGTIAVSDIQDVNFRPGQVLVYKDGTGPPTLLTNPLQYYYLADAYDARGNLFVIGRTHTREVILSECPRGKAPCDTISIAGATIYFPTVLEWYRPGGYLIIGDGECGNALATCLYRFSVSGSTATLLGKTTLTNHKGGPACTIEDPVVVGDDTGAIIIGGSDTLHTRGCDQVPPNVARWAFPSGGEPINGTSSELSRPFGAAISASPR